MSIIITSGIFVPVENEGNKKKTQINIKYEQFEN